MSNSKQENKGGQDPVKDPKNAHKIIEGEIKEVYDKHGHSGIMIDPRDGNREYVFETTQGISVAVGEPVTAAVHREEHASSTGQEHKNKDHGGPKALIITGGGSVPPRV